MTVYTNRIYVFACDALGCEQVSEETLSDNPDAGRRSAWRIARRELGWIERDGRQYCPSHRS